MLRGIDVALKVRDGGPDWALTGVERDPTQLARASVTIPGLDGQSLKVYLPAVLAATPADGNAWLLTQGATDHGASIVAVNAPPSQNGIILNTGRTTEPTLNQIVAAFKAWRQGGAAVWTDADLELTGDGTALLDQANMPSLLRFAGGGAQSDAIRAVTDATAKTITVHYHPDDTLAEIVAGINESRDVEATLLHATDGATMPEETGFSRPFGYGKLAGGISAAADLLQTGLSAGERKGLEIGLTIPGSGADWSLRGRQRQLAVRASAVLGTGANTVTITLPETLVDPAGGNNWTVGLVASGTAQVAANVGADVQNRIRIYVSNTGITLDQIKSLIVAASVLTVDDIVVAGAGGTIIPRPSSEQITNFSGGIAEEPLEAAADRAAKTYTIEYDAGDTLQEIADEINAGDDAKATLISGSDAAAAGETVPFTRPFEGRRGGRGPQGEPGEPGDDGEPIEGRVLNIDPSGANNRTIQLPANARTYDHGIIEWTDSGQYVEMSFDVGSLPTTGSRTFRSGGSRRATYTAATNAFTLNGGSFSGGHLYDAGTGGEGGGGGSGGEVVGGAGVDQAARDAAEAADAKASTALQNAALNEGHIVELLARRRTRLVYTAGVNSAGALAAIDTSQGDIYVASIRGTSGTGLPWADNDGIQRTSGDVVLWSGTAWVEINEGIERINRLTGLRVTDVADATGMQAQIASQFKDARFVRITADFTLVGVTYKTGDILVYDTENSVHQLIYRRRPIPEKAADADIDAESDDSDYVTVAGVFRAIARKVKAASSAVAGIVSLANRTPLGPGTSGEAGSDTSVSRADHRHPLPTLNQLNTQLAGRILPALPAEGSRDNKVPKFDGNTLGWEPDATASGGSGLDQAAVDARVAAGVADWAEEGDVTAIPASKLANAPAGEIADDSIAYAKALATTAAQKLGWRAKLGSASISVGATLPAVAEQNEGDIRILSQDVASGLSYGDISAPASTLTSASTADVFQVWTLRGSKQWVRLGNLHVRPADWATEGNNDAIPSSKLTNAGGGGSSELTPVIVPSTTTAIAFGIHGQSTWPPGMSREGGVSGTTYWRDYRDLHGLQFIIDSATVTADINVNMADLRSLNDATGGRDETKSRLFEIINYRSQGGITFSGGGISNIRPSGARLEPGYKGLVSLTPWKVSNWLLSLGAFTPLTSDAAIATAVSNALPPFFGIDLLPAGIEGGALADDYPDHIDVVFTERQTSKTITGVTLHMAGQRLALNAATPVSGINDPFELHGILRFDVAGATKRNLARVVTDDATMRFLLGLVTITFSDGSTHLHNVAWAIRNASFGPHPESWAARGNADAIPAGKLANAPAAPFSPSLVHSGSVDLFASRTVDLGFDWPEDAEYLAIQTSLGGTGSNDEQIRIIRNPRKGETMLSTLPVTAVAVGGTIKGNRSQNIGIAVRHGVSSTQAIYFGRTAANRATAQSSTDPADPMPLVVARI